MGKNSNIVKVVIDSYREKIVRRMSLFLLKLERVLIDFRINNLFLGLSESTSDICHCLINF